MATAVYTERRTTMRILDGTPTTPQYIVIPFVQAGMTVPINRPRPEPEPVLNRGQLDTYAHYVRRDDTELMAPLAMTGFSANLDEQFAKIVIHAMSNPYNATPWLVSTATFITAAGTGASILNGTGGSFAPPQFTDDPTHRRVVVEHRVDGVVTGVNATVWRHEEVYFPPHLLTVQLGQRVVLSGTYWTYGKITMLTAFTTGVDRTPAVA
jgi:hypothetical protein